MIESLANEYKREMKQFDKETALPKKMWWAIASIYFLIIVVWGIAYYCLRKLEVQDELGDILSVIMISAVFLSSFIVKDDFQLEEREGREKELKRLQLVVKILKNYGVNCLHWREQVDSLIKEFEKLQKQEKERFQPERNLIQWIANDSIMATAVMTIIDKIKSTLPWNESILLLVQMAKLQIAIVVGFCIIKVALIDLILDAKYHLYGRIVHNLRMIEIFDVFNALEASEDVCVEGQKKTLQ